MSIGIDKQYLRAKVSEAIKQMPYDVVIYREKLNAYKEPEGYIKVTELVGMLYKDSDRNIQINLSDKGEVNTPINKKFLVDYNDKSILVQEGDFLFWGNKCWEIISLGEEFEIYFEMVVKEHEWFEV